MNVLIVYDSVYGNTKKVAEAIGTAISEASSASQTVRTMRATELQQADLSGVELLIAGAPTQKFNPTPGLKDTLQALPAKSLQGMRAAAFDTRIAEADADNKVFSFMVKRFGYAAEKIADMLKKKGAALVLPPEPFYVKGTEGPLQDGELERAAAWALKTVAPVEVKRG
jgi:flavodoxin